MFSFLVNSPILVLITHLSILLSVGKPKILVHVGLDEKFSVLIIIICNDSVTTYKRFLSQWKLRYLSVRRNTSINTKRSKVGWLYVMWLLSHTSVCIELTNNTNLILIMKQKLKNVKAMYDLVISCIKYNQNSIGRNISTSYSMKKKLWNL